MEDLTIRIVDFTNEDVDYKECETFDEGVSRITNTIRDNQRQGIFSIGEILDKDNVSIYCYPVPNNKRM